MRSWSRVRYWCAPSLLTAFAHLTLALLPLETNATPTEPAEALRMKLQAWSPPEFPAPPASPAPLEAPAAPAARAEPIAPKPRPAAPAAEAKPATRVPRLEELESEPEARAPTIPRRVQRSAATVAPDWARYRRGVHSALVSSRRYPPMARRLGLEGVAVVRITVARDGRLRVAPRVLASTGHRILDEEILQMVRRAAPFTALPAGHETATFELPVRFALRD